MEVEYTAQLQETVSRDIEVYLAHASVQTDSDHADW